MDWFDIRFGDPVLHPWTGDTRLIVRDIVYEDEPMIVAAVVDDLYRGGLTRPISEFEPVLPDFQEAWIAISQAMWAWLDARTDEELERGWSSDRLLAAVRDLRQAADEYLRNADYVQRINQV